jgi:hypothetical protein
MAAQSRQSARLSLQTSKLAPSAPFNSKVGHIRLRVRGRGDEGTDTLVL